MLMGCAVFSWETVNLSFFVLNITFNWLKLTFDETFCSSIDQSCIVNEIRGCVMKLVTMQIVTGVLERKLCR